MRKEQKQYDRQFKLEAVEYFLSQDKSAKKIAEHFGVCAKTFYSWVREYKENGTNSFRGKGGVIITLLRRCHFNIAPTKKRKS